jgi:Double-GTPase 1
VSSLRISLVGLPSSGKTTYLAALWAYLKPSDDPAAFRIASWPENRAYLQKIADDWFAGRPLDHTPTGLVGEIDFSVKAEGQPELRIQIPDLSGEVYKRAVAYRLIEQAVVDELIESNFILLFVSAIEAKTPICLTDLGHGVDGAHNELGAVDFDAENLESDWLNADLLQIVLALLREADRTAPPVTVVVSAWDTVQSLHLTPDAWLRRTQPALAQLIRELARTTPTFIVGISAQGGDYATDPDITRADPHARAIVQVNETVNADITAPLRWFLEPS